MLKNIYKYLTTNFRIMGVSLFPVIIVQMPLLDGYKMSTNVTKVSHMQYQQIHPVLSPSRASLIDTLTHQIQQLMEATEQFIDRKYK